MASTKAFSLAGKSLKLDTAEDIAPHIEPLANLADVESVDFSGNTIGIGAAEALASLLSTRKSLTSANLADIFTSRLLSEIPPAIDALLKALLTLPNLHTVNLNDNAFGLNTCDPLVAFLAAHTPLEHLYLNNNGLGPIAGSKIADALASLAAKKAEAGAKPLRTVVCGRNRLENGSMASWAKAYSVHTGVTHIRMVQNGIRPDGIATLFKNGLKNVKGVQVLELEDNTFTAKGSKALADIIAKWEDLQYLNLNDCYLSSRGFIMVAESMRAGKNSKLETMKLTYGNLNADGVKMIGDIAQFLPALKRVELNGNKFSEEDIGIDQLKEVLDQRREKAGADKDDETWGLDELDELDSDEEEDDGSENSEDEDEDEEHEEVLKRADEAEGANVAQDESKDVDKLADLLGKTGI